MAAKIGHLRPTRRLDAQPFDRPIPNRLLRMLPSIDLELLTPNMQEVALAQRATLRAQGVETKYAYFPSSGMISFIHHTRDGVAVEAGVVGDEGGIGLLLATSPAPQRIEQLTSHPTLAQLFQTHNSFEPFVVEQ